MQAKQAAQFLARKPALAGVCIFLVVFVMIEFLRAGGGLQALELAAYDALLRWRPPAEAPDERVVLIKITDRDISMLGHWPISDERLAEAIEKIAHAGPRAIGFDLYRDLPVPPGGERLRSAFESTPQLVFAEKFGRGDEPAVPAPPALVGSDRAGFADLMVDPGGVVRRALLFLDDGERVAYSLPLRLALLYLAAEGIGPEPGSPDPAHIKLGPTTLVPFARDDGAYVDADDRGYQVLLDFHGGLAPFRSYSLEELLAGRMPAEAMRDKLVLVGVTADSVKDFFITPFSGEHDVMASIPGMYLHAHAARQFLRQALDGAPPVRVLTARIEQVWTMLWTAFGVLLAMKLRNLVRLVVALALSLTMLAVGAYVAMGHAWWIPLAPPALGLLAALVMGVAYLASLERTERRFVMEIFAKHVSGDVADEIWRQRDNLLSDGRIEARELTVTVLFSDLADFTPIAEQLSAREMMGWLNDYMECMAGLVFAYGGVVDDYYGDAIKANFGAPLARTTQAEIADDARRAVSCALAMAEAMNEINARYAKQALPPARMRIGLSTGRVVAGCLGSADRMKYTTIGDVVNTAARLQAYGKEIAELPGPCTIVIAGTTKELLDDDFDLRFVGDASLKGKQQSVPAWRVLDCTGPWAKLRHRAGRRAA